MVRLSLILIPLQERRPRVVLGFRDAEQIAGAFYATDPEPILRINTDDVPDDWPYKPWPCRATRLRRMRDGRLQAVQVDVHPDPRVQRIVEQVREAGAIQNLDRVRPIYNRRELVAMNELVLDLTYDRIYRHRELVEGGNRIERALAIHGVLPLSPSLLAEHFPEMGSESTARRAVRAWRKWGQTSNQSPIWKLTPFNFRVEGQRGRPSVVLVAGFHADPKAAAEAVLGPLAAFWRANEPQPASQPEARPEPPQAGDVGPSESWLPPPAWQRMPGGGAGAPIWQARAPPDD
jgi:hypothetical protein